MVVILALTVSANAVDIQVPGQYPTISMAVSQAAAGDRILVQSNTYVESVTVTKDLEIIGVNGAATTFIQGTSTSGVTVSPGVTATISGFDILGDEYGLRVQGGAIVSADDLHFPYAVSFTSAEVFVESGGELTIRNSTLENNSGFEPGLLMRIDGGTVVVEDSLFFDGIASIGNGGGVWVNNAGDFTARRVEFRENSTVGDGGALGVVNGSVALIEDSSFLNNDADDDGASIYAIDGTVDVVDTSFSGDRADDDGSAIGAYGGSVVTCTRCTIEDSGGLYSKAISVYGDLTVVDSTMSNNLGGAIYHSEGALTVTGVVFDTNNHSSVGGVESHGFATALVEESLFTGSYGQAIRLVWGGIAEIRDVEVIDNTGEGVEISFSDAGIVQGLRIEASPEAYLELTELGAATAVDNTFIWTYSNWYGGIFADIAGPFEVRRNLFCANAGVFAAGGVYIAQATNAPHAVEVTNNLFVSNTADLGGGITVWGDYPGWQPLDVNLSNNTFVANNARNGSGEALYFDASEVALSSNVFTEHTGGSAVYAGADALGTASYNLWYDNALDLDGSVAMGAGNTFVDPRLVGGDPVTDCSAAIGFPQPGSATIDAGDPDPSLNDLDGSPNDVGLLGGPHADPAWWADDDGDGLVFHFDCDDQDVGVGLAPWWYFDSDADTYGDPAVNRQVCVAPGPDWTADDTDCDDTQALINPDTIWFPDLDADGLGDLGAPSAPVCVAPADHVLDDTDCDDTDPSVMGPPTWYADIDADGYGDASLPMVACVVPPGFAASSDDCDDSDPTAYPGADEWCDGVDNDCDTIVDEDDAVDVQPWWVDADEDGYGDELYAPIYTCYAPDGHLDNGDDCDDSVTQINPGAVDTCGDGYDQDCDGVGLLTDDEDGDGLTTEVELAIPSDPCNIDSDGDGVDDGTEFGGGDSPQDTDQDGDPDVTDVDDDGDGIPTEDELGGDLDNDGIPDYLDDTDDSPELTDTDDPGTTGSDTDESGEGDKGGCACDATGSSPGGAALFLGLGLVALRRRKCSVRVSCFA